MQALNNALVVVWIHRTMCKHYGSHVDMNLKCVQANNSLEELNEQYYVNLKKEKKYFICPSYIIAPFGCVTHPELKQIQLNKTEKITMICFAHIWTNWELIKEEWIHNHIREWIYDY